MIVPLTRIFWASLSLGHIPGAWTGSRVVFILEAGMASYTSPKNFYPISLKSCVLKKVEKLIDKCIRGWPLLSILLSENQHAYQTGQSTQTALSTAVFLL